MMGADSNIIEENWTKFFEEAGIPQREAAQYAEKFYKNRIKFDMLGDLNVDLLEKMGITILGDVIRVLRHIKQIGEKKNVNLANVAAGLNDVPSPEKSPGSSPPKPKKSRVEEFKELIKNRNDVPSDVTAEVSSIITSLEKDNVVPIKKPRITPESIPELNLTSSCFSKISRFNTYIDKTSIIEVIVRKKSFVLVTAPRRFGKSSILSLIKHFFVLEEKEGVPVSKSFLDDKNAPINDTTNYKLFTDPPLDITNHEVIMRQHFGKYPVIFINFLCKTPETLEDLKDECGRIIQNVFNRHNYLMKSSKLTKVEKNFCQKFCNGNKKFIAENITSSLKTLSSYLCKHFGQKCVVLIDEYDYLCSQAMMELEKTDIIKAIKLFIDILGLLLKDNDNVEFAFITGISFISTTGFSSIMNVVSYKFLQNDDFIQFYGLTENEFVSLLKPYVSEEVLNDAMVYYNGYEYCGMKIYSIWSALNVLNSNSKLVKNYWITSGIFQGFTGALKIPIVKIHIEHLLQGNTISIKPLLKLYPKDVVTLRDNFTNPNLEVSDVDPLFNFYLEQGYLTTVGRVSRNSFNVRIPNEEIKFEFLKLITEYYSLEWGVDFSLIAECACYLNEIFNEPRKYVEKFCAGLKEICEKLTIKDSHPFNEAALHHLVYFIIIKSRYKCLTEIYCLNKKRLDLCSLFNEFGNVIELKVNQASLIALKQILTNKYHSVFKNEKYTSREIEHYLLLGINVTKQDDDIKVDICYLLDNDDEKNVIKL